MLEEIIIESDGNFDKFCSNFKSSKVGAFVNLIKTKQQQNEDLASVKICSKRISFCPKDPCYK